LLTGTLKKAKCFMLFKEFGSYFRISRFIFALFLKHYVFFPVSLVDWSTLLRKPFYVCTKTMPLCRHFWIYLLLHWNSFFFPQFLISLFNNDTI
jgi:hypothetical protein